jgi:hypothetical protein
MESTHRFPQSLEIAARFPHSPQAGDEADGKVENQKQGFPLSHRTILSPQRTQKTNRLTSLLSGNKSREATGKIIVAKREKYLTPNTV